MTPADLDALVARLNDAAYRFGDSYPVDAARQREAAAALVQLREENARLKDRLEAQFKRLTSMDGLLANADARIAALEAERDALKQDALRYRWLREKLVYQKSGPHYGWTLDELIPGDERDAAIDAARSKP